VCLALPARVVEVHPGQVATVDLDGVRRKVSTALLEDVAVGDYVLLHVGFALTRLDVEEAEATLALFAALPK
jgi:hydrogenase expression/formation protein HypC